MLDICRRQPEWSGPGRVRSGRPELAAGSRRGARARGPVRCAAAAAAADAATAADAAVVRWRDVHWGLVRDLVPGCALTAHLYGRAIPSAWQALLSAHICAVAPDHTPRLFWPSLVTQSIVTSASAHAPDRLAARSRCQQAKSPAAATAAGWRAAVCSTSCGASPHRQLATLQKFIGHAAETLNLETLQKRGMGCRWVAPGCGAAMGIRRCG
jgi:hypothetical protein